MSADRPMRIGVSACIAGQAVRFDGSACRAPGLLSDLTRYAELVTVCPEVGAGMPIPRETVRLVRRAGEAEPRMIARSGADWTEAMNAFTDAKLDELAALDLCGFVVKTRSPSCGLERVRVYGSGGVPRKDGVGLFTRKLRERFPSLPVEEDGRLTDRMLRENFLEAVFAYARWRALVTRDPSTRELVEYQRDNKYLLFSHSPAAQAELGRLVAGAGRDRSADLLDRYGELQMRCLQRRARPRDHVQTLRKIARHLKRAISSASSRELDGAISEFDLGHSPRAVPLALVKHHALDKGIDYLASQTYLAPYPVELRRA